jgi:hypothetical protein
MTATIKHAALLAATLIFAGCTMGVEEGGTKATAITLSENTWANGSITQTRGEQWFTFTATAGTQYLHIDLGTFAYLYAQVYDKSDNQIGDRMDFSGSGSGSVKLTVTVGKVYYIKVTSSSGAGAYRIAFNTMESPPLPPGVLQAATTLAENRWTGGAITSSNNEQWFRFTATAGTQYLHVRFGTLPGLYGLYIQIYDRDGGILENGVNLSNFVSSQSLPVTSGQVCYVKVSGRESGIGTYWIALSASAAAPPTN